MRSSEHDLFKGISFGNHNLSLIRERLKFYKADRKFSAGSNSVEDLIMDMSRLEPIPIALLKEKAGSKGLVTSIERYLNGVQTPRKLRLQAISRLLIYKSYLSLSELKISSGESGADLLSHNLSSFLSHSSSRSEKKQEILIGEYHLREKLKSGRAKISHLNILDNECGCCLRVKKTVTFVTNKKFRRQNVINSNYCLEGWVSQICSQNSLAFLKRNFDGKIFPQHLTVTQDVCVEVRDSRNISKTPQIFQ